MAKTTNKTSGLFHLALGYLWKYNNYRIGLHGAFGADAYKANQSNSYSVTFPTPNYFKLPNQTGGSAVGYNVLAHQSVNASLYTKMSSTFDSEFAAKFAYVAMNKIMSGFYVGANVARYRMTSSAVINLPQAGQVVVNNSNIPGLSKSKTTISPILGLFAEYYVMHNVTVSLRYGFNYARPSLNYITMQNLQISAKKVKVNTHKIVGGVNYYF